MKSLHLKLILIAPAGGGIIVSPTPPPPPPYTYKECVNIGVVCL